MNLKPSEIKRAEDEKRRKEMNELYSKKEKNTINVDEKKIRKRLNKINVDEKKIRKRLNKIFNKKINNLYKSLVNEDDKWNENVRKFIEYHEEFDIDEYENNMETDIVNEIGMELFAGDKCADIDEDEFDGPNDLAQEEWALVDDIILYYYYND